MFPIAVTVVTGFLGSGKTTLINRLLEDPALRDTAVIVNEFGEIPIDHLLVESSSDEVIEIAGGCLCCTVRGELADTLAGLVERVQTGKIKRLSRIVIETTGMADPVPVLHAIQSHPALAQGLAIDRVITTVDAIAGLSIIGAHEEARRQIAVADIVVLTKTDLADSGQSEALWAAIAAKSTATIIRADALAGNHANLLQYDVLVRDPPDRGIGHSHHHEHASEVTSHAIIHDAPVAWPAVEGFLGFITSRIDLDILRIKGLVLTKENPDRPVLVQGVQKTLYPQQRLERWPDRATRETVLVMIGKGLNGEEIDRLFKAFIGIPQTDMPDRAALEANPLAITGMR